jgi:kinesin family protein 2/24
VFEIDPRRMRRCPRNVPDVKKLDSGILRVVPSDREKAGAGAKIKVVVRKRPLNKKDISKKEEDIITIEPNHTSLTVHETKLKVDLTAYVEKHEFVFDAVLDDQVSNDEVSSLPK